MAKWVHKNENNGNNDFIDLETCQWRNDECVDGGTVHSKAYAHTCGSHITIPQMSIETWERMIPIKMIQFPATFPPSPPSPVPVISLFPVTQNTLASQMRRMMVAGDMCGKLPNVTSQVYIHIRFY